MAQFRGTPAILILVVQSETRGSCDLPRRQLPAVSGAIILTAVRFGSGEPEQGALIRPRIWQLAGQELTRRQRRRLAPFNDRRHDVRRHACEPRQLAESRPAAAVGRSDAGDGLVQLGKDQFARRV